jgi:uracil-DNA glycosylase family 4
MTSPREQARRALKQCLELERAFGADVLPRRRAPKPRVADGPTAGGDPAPGAPPAATSRPAGNRGASSPRPAAPPPPPRDPAAGLEGEARASFLALRDEALACVKCVLHRTRTQVVFGVGTPRAALMFVGEAPGADEDAQGEPFVGRAGQLLTKTLAELGVRREEVYIGNILKCRPPDNRKPEPGEAALCFPYLRRQIEIIRPKILCALGAVAAQGLLGTADPISRIRGQLFDFPWLRGIRVFPTFHPAYLLRSPWEMPKFKQDLRRVLSELHPSP